MANAKILQAIIEDNKVTLPIGFELKILAVDKKRLKEIKQVKLLNGPQDSLFIALFEDDDADFQLEVNTFSSKSIRLTIDVNEKSYRFFAPPNSYCKMEALESNGDKLHFVSQGTGEGKVLLAEAAAKFGTSYQEASLLCSRMRFQIDVEKKVEKKVAMVHPFSDLEIKGDPMQIYIKTIMGKTIIIKIGIYNTIEELKLFVQKKEGCPADQQRLIIAGVEGDNCQTLERYNIQEGFTIHLVLLLRGGGSAFEQVAIPDDGEQPVPQLHGERGVICFGERSNQTFKRYRGHFIVDENYKVKPFIIEMRMASRYRI